MQHDLLESLAALRYDQQPNGLASRDERLLDRMAAGDQLFLVT